MGIIKREGHKDKVCLNNYNFGDKYMLFFISQAIKTYKLSGNRITEKSANVLLNTINKFAQEIDLSKNKIGSLGC